MKSILLLSTQLRSSTQVADSTSRAFSSLELRYQPYLRESRNPHNLQKPEETGNKHHLRSGWERRDLSRHKFSSTDPPTMNGTSLWLFLLIAGAVVLCASSNNPKNQGNQQGRANKPRAGGPDIMSNNNGGGGKCGHGGNSKESAEHEEKQQKAK